MNKNIILISFYNPKSLGIRYIENALLQGGFHPYIIFFKNFHSSQPKSATQKELNELKKLIKKINPLAVGLSVMASLYLETVYAVCDCIKEISHAKIVWGGVYPTMFPDRALKHADFVIRSEGEKAFTQLANELLQDSFSYEKIKNLVYKKGNKIYHNELDHLLDDLDFYGIPQIGGSNKYLIENNEMKQIDPQLKSVNYELSASRGCPYACSYCCSINLHRIVKGKGNYVRFRKVDDVMEELIQAKKKIKFLKVIHFWDEIFCDDEQWIDEFVKRYKKEIALPFEIWGHPLKTNEHLMKKLKDAGLFKVVMGIQSGSAYVRKQIFHRPEKQEDIYKASNTLSSLNVPQVIFDFMLRHPFETHETLKETYDLCLQLSQPFELQLHGLNFLPGTDIVQKAIDEGYYSEQEMDTIMHSSMKKQYNMHWSREEDDSYANFLYRLIYLTQFPQLHDQAIKKINMETPSKKDYVFIDQLCRKAKIKEKIRYYKQKAKIVMLGTITS